ncbi:von Willebrand factor A domain-containing protein 2-like [Dendronephthya gigantea]|uniref:von Willebrand factor A domain-containing protein 2-like n=1 Tax=Dendronephthya gigantea TaxID=151771 RepID=UPI00106CCCA0|nr:von Willebrand factor A domain-containing protein 2-like [Dendronephthya gigantea]
MKWSLISFICLMLHVASTLAQPKQVCKKVVDLAMVLDESGSIGAANFVIIKGFVADVISRFSVSPYGAHFAAVKYSSSPREVFSLTKYTNAAQLQTAVRNINYQGGGTYTGKALDYVRQNIFGQAQDRKDAPNVLVIFTDGQSSDHNRAVQAAAQLKGSGVAILCVAIGDGATNPTLLQQLGDLASKPGYVFKSNVAALDTIKNELVREICKSIPACKSQPCKNGGQCVDTDTEYRCNCPPDWTGVNCEVPKYCPAVSFSKRGCYKTPEPKPDSSKLLFNRRSKIDWGQGWDKYLDDVVCDCGKEAKAQGYKYFLIEFHGECWGYGDFDVNQPHAGAGNCWGKRPNYQICDETQMKPICVGTGDHGYLYHLD